VKHLSLAAYKWLTMRLGVQTVKPDVHLHRFVESAVGHPVTDTELIRALETVARDRPTGSPPRLGDLGASARIGLGSDLFAGASPALPRA
jgi:hypothetical protein